MTETWLQTWSVCGDAGDLMRQRKKGEFFSFNKECFNQEFCFAEPPELISRALLRNPAGHMSEELHQGMRKLQRAPSDSWISLVKVDFEGIKPQHLQAALIVGWVSSPKKTIVIALQRGSSGYRHAATAAGNIERGPGALRRTSRAATHSRLAPAHLDPTRLLMS